jgi:hypothetical protein
MIGLRSVNSNAHVSLYLCKARVWLVIDSDHRWHCVRIVFGVMSGYRAGLAA